MPFLRRFPRAILINIVPRIERWTYLYPLVCRDLYSAGRANAELMNDKSSAVFVRPQGYRRRRA